MQPSDNDDIPTLSDLIFPGNPQKIKEKLEPEPTIRQQIDQMPREDIQTIRPKPSSSNLEKKIGEHIDFILNKHMMMARAEITKVIMAELRTRLPKGKKSSKG